MPMVVASWARAVPRVASWHSRPRGGRPCHLAFSAIGRVWPRPRPFSHRARARSVTTPAW
eukprot:15459013-Alexandrium_andersonii.AAC.1